MLFDHVYLLVTRNRRRSSVIVDVHYVSAIFKLYLIVTLFSCLLFVIAFILSSY